MKSAKAFLLKFDPSLKNEDVEKMNDFSGEFLLYMMSEYAKDKSNQSESVYLELYCKKEQLDKYSNIVKNLVNEGWRKAKQSQVIKDMANQYYWKLVKSILYN